MAERLFKSSLGFKDANISRLSGAGVPGGDSSFQDAAGVGSVYSNISNGDIYRKHTAGAGAGNWERVPDLSDITGFGNSRSWREPVRVYTTDDAATVIADLNADDAIQGISIAVDDRLLLNDGGASPNVYIVGGSTGAWTLTEDTNEETSGDTVKVLEGDEAGNEYTYNGATWVWTDSSTGAEDGFQNTFTGKSSVGSELPSYTSTNFIANNDPLTTAIGKLDTQVNTNTTEISNNATSITNLTTSNGNVQAEVDAIETALGGSVDVNGDYVPHTGSNYLDSNTSVTQDILDLDAQAKVNSDAIGVNVGNISTNTTNIGNLQTEVDNTQGGAGLAANGAYTAHTGSNYIDAGTSLHNTDLLLDAAIKANADAIGALGTGSINDLQTEVDAIEAGMGAVIDVNGDYVAHTGTNYIDINTSVTEDLTDLDTQLKVASDAASDAQTNVDAVETSLGGIVNSSGVYVPLTGTTYINGNTSVTEDLTDLDSAINGVAGSANGLQTEVDKIETSLGGMIDGNGDYVAHSGTNYIDSNSDVAEDLTDLDTAIKANEDVSTSIQTEVDAIESAMGAMVGTDGTYNAHSGTNYIDGNSDVAEDLTDLDTQVKSNADAISSLNTQLTSTVVHEEGTGAASHSLDSLLVDDNVAAKWLVTATDASGNREAIEVYAMHDGYGANDATTVDWTRYAKIKAGNISGLDFDVTLSGVGAAQALNLVVSASGNIDVSSTRLSA